MELFDKMLELSRLGYFCSQILIMLALERDEEENHALVRALGGLNGGLGFSGRICGALTGGCCLISYYAGKGEDEEIEDANCSAMISELCSWFESEYGSQYGSCNCSSILENNPQNKLLRCPCIVEATYVKAMELLQENGSI